MVFIRLLLLSPPLLLIFTRLANSLDSTQQLLNSVDILQDSNDTLMEGSGEEGSGLSVSLNDDDDIVSSTLIPDKSILSLSSSMDSGSLRSRSNSIIDKRATDPTNHKLGNLPSDFLGKMDFRSSSLIPPTALMALNRPLKKGQGIVQREYVALLVQADSSPPSLPSSNRRWGRLFINSSGLPQAEFVDGNVVKDARRDSIPFRSILLPSNAASTYNIDMEWVLSRLVDPLSIVVQVDTRRPYSKITAGVYVTPNGEYLGEADIERRIFTYVYNGQAARVVDGRIFDESVYVLTKSTCSCSCQSKGGSIFANIKDFFG